MPTEATWGVLDLLEMKFQVTEFPSVDAGKVGSTHNSLAISPTQHFIFLRLERSDDFSILKRMPQPSDFNCFMSYSHRIIYRYI